MSAASRGVNSSVVTTLSASPSGRASARDFKV